MNFRLLPSMLGPLALLFVASCGQSSEDAHLDSRVDSLESESQEAPGRTEVPPGARVVVTGDPCPALFDSAVSGDFEAVTLLFSETLLSSSRTTFRCRFHLDYTFPAGYRLWRPSAVARGFAQVPEGGNTSVWAVRTRLNGGAWASKPRLLPGPFEDDFQIDVPGGEEQKEAPSQCGSTSARIDVEVIGSLFSPGKTPAAFLSTLDSVDTEIDWQRCP